MNKVVNFLSFLAVTEEQGGVKRMLGVCSEFERIAKVVLEKGDKESHSRRKRKTKDATEDTASLTPLPPVHNAPPTPVSTNNSTTPAPTFSPNFANTDINNQAFNTSLNAFSTPLPNSDAMSLPLDFNPSPSSAMFQSLMSPPTTSSLSPNFSGDMQLHYNPSDGPSPLNVGSFQQPFVPQDLWQMPMTLEWDWADMTSNGFAYDGSDAGQQQQTSSN